MRETRNIDATFASIMGAAHHGRCSGENARPTDYKLRSRLDHASDETKHLSGM